MWKTFTDKNTTFRYLGKTKLIMHESSGTRTQNQQYKNICNKNSSKSRKIFR
jgi:hypothetical protein